MKLSTLKSVIYCLLLMVVGCNVPLPEVPTPIATIEATAIVPTTVPTIVPSATPGVIWLPGVNCDYLRVDSGFALVNGNPCLQRTFETTENEVPQVYPLGYLVSSEPGADAYSGHSAMSVANGRIKIPFTRYNSTNGAHINGFWGYTLRGQHITPNTCHIVKVTGTSYLTNPESSDNYVMRLSINGSDWYLKDLPTTGTWENKIWPIYTTNPANSFDLTFQVGTIWATSGGYVLLDSIQVLSAPIGYCDGAGTSYF